MSSDAATELANVEMPTENPVKLKARISIFTYPHLRRVGGSRVNLSACPPPSSETRSLITKHSSGDSQLVGLLSGFLARRRRLAGKAPVSLLGARVVALGRDLSAPPPNSSTVASDLPNLRHLPPRLSLAFFLHRSFFVTNTDAACVTRLSHLVMNSA